MIPRDEPPRINDWRLFRYFEALYPQHLPDWDKLWEEIQTYEQHFVNQWLIVNKWKVGSQFVAPERPDVPVRISQIIAPDEIPQCWFDEWSESEFPSETNEEANSQLPSAASKQPEPQWYYGKSGIVLGPVTLRWIARRLAAGRLEPSDLLWREGLEDWIPASDVDDLMPRERTPDEWIPADSQVVIPGTPVVARLEVAGCDLEQAFRLIAKTTGIGRRNVSFEFRDGSVVIGFDEVRNTIPAVGFWPGIATVSRVFVKKMATFDLRKLQMVAIACHDGRITIADRSHECKWTEP